MKRSRYASACLALAVTITLLTACKGQEGEKDHPDSQGSDSTAATVVVNGKLINKPCGPAGARFLPNGWLVF